MVTRDRDQVEIRKGQLGFLPGGHLESSAPTGENTDTPTGGPTRGLPADLQQHADDAWRRFERQYRALANR